MIDRQKIINLIVENLSEDLLKPQYRDKNKNKLWGHCYVASECFFHIMGGKDIFQPMRIKIGDINHWFLKDKRNDDIIDITAKQFNFDIDYSKSVRASFLTKEPSKRAKILIERVESMLFNEENNYE